MQTVDTSRRSKASQKLPLYEQMGSAMTSYMEQVAPFARTFTTTTKVVLVSYVEASQIL